MAKSPKKTKSKDKEVSISEDASMLIFPKTTVGVSAAQEAYREARCPTTVATPRYDLMSPPIRYCEDCRFHKLNTYLDQIYDTWRGDHRCKRALVISKSGNNLPVTRGSGEKYYPLCDDMRLNDKLCGKHARWFEPKPPSRWKEFLKRFKREKSEKAPANVFDDGRGNRYYDDGMVIREIPKDG